MLGLEFLCSIVHRPPLFGTPLVCTPERKLFDGLNFFLLLLRRQHLRDEPAGKLSFAPGFHIKIANDGKNDCSDKVHEQILHRVQNPDIQVTAQSQRMLCAVGGDHDHVGDIPDGGGVVAAQRVQHDRRVKVNYRMIGI